MKRLVRDRRREYDRQAKSSAKLAQVLDRAKDDSEGPWAERAAAGRDFYRMLAVLYASRAAIYTSPSFSNRLDAWRTMLRMRGHLRDCGFGRKALLMDACAGVIPTGRMIWS
jgi:hypothetical protein